MKFVIYINLLSSFHFYSKDKILSWHSKVALDFIRTVQKAFCFVSTICIFLSSCTLHTQRETEELNTSFLNSDSQEITHYQNQSNSSLDLPLKPKIDIKKVLGEQFYQSLAYFENMKDVKLNWTLALPLSPPPCSVREAGAASFFNDNLHHYTLRSGALELREAIKKRFEKDGLKFTDKNIIVSTSIFDILDDLYSILNLSPNNGILIPTPAFGKHVYQVANKRLKVHLIKASASTLWKILPKDLDNVLTRTKAKVFLFTNPVNPTGVVYTKREIEAIAKVIKKHQILVISDEIFKDVLLDNNEPAFSIGAVEGMEKFTITVNGLGKSMGLAGLRVSYGVIPEWLRDKFPKPSCGLSCPAEKAAIAALQDTAENRLYLKTTIREYGNRVKLIKNLINKTNNELNKKFNLNADQLRSYIKLYVEPKATNIVLVSFPEIKGKYCDKAKIKNSNDLASFILSKSGVALMPGEMFFIEGEEMVLRIPLAAKNLTEGFHKIKDALLQLK